MGGRVVATAALILIMPSAAVAAGLGDLVVKSSLGEPLSAEIELRSPRKGERIIARIGSPDTYRYANVEYNEALAATHINVQRRPDGRPYLQASSPLPISEPVVHLVVELESRSRDVIGHYTLLLDPPSAAMARRRTEKPDAVALIKPPADFFPKPGTAAAAALESPRFAIARFQVEGATSVPSSVVDNALREFTGPNKDFATIQSAVAVVQKTYADAGFGAVRVLIPEQDIENGVVRLQIAEARIAKVEVIGQKHYSEGNIRRSLPALREGEIPNMHEVGAALRLANEATTKHTQITFTQTASPTLVDAVVRVVDTPTQRWALSADNTGSAQTGEWRTGIAYQNNNLWDRDHAFGFQAVTSPEQPADVVILGVNYRVPLYTLGAAVEFVAGHSNVNSGVVNTPGGSYGIRGSGDFAGVHYIYLLPRIGQWDQRLNLGLDYRYFKNDVSLVGTGGSVIPNLQALPASITYSGFIRNVPTEWAASIGVARNIPFGSNGTTEAFQRPGGRAGAEADYTIVRYGVDLSRQLPADWRLRAAWNGQWTRDALIPGEQFAIGGIDSVRGLRERAISNDKGDRASVEIYTPTLGTLPYETQARVLAFVDAGTVRRNRALPGETTKSSATSAGLGLRVNVAASAQLRVDTGYVLSDDAQYPRGSTRTHARLLYLF